MHSELNSLGKSRLETTRVPVATSWLLSGSRAVLALIGGLVITFTFAVTSVTLTFIVFGAYALALGVLALIFFPKVADRAVRNAHLIAAIVSILAGAVALVMLQLGSISLFLLVVTIWAAITGFAELYLGFAKRGKFAEHRDWLFAGVVTCLLALSTLIIDPDYQNGYLVPGDDVLPDFEGTVTGSLFGIGVFGVYLIIIGVFLFIGAYSLKNPQSDIVQQNAAKVTTAGDNGPKPRAEHSTKPVQKAKES